jgi:serralysin
MEGRFANAVNALGNSGANVIHGSEGPDFINGFSGSDVVFGRGGDDQLFGGNGLDRLDGGRGDDEIHDFHGRNRFAGGRGDDRLQTGSTARDEMTGGAGADRFVWETPAAAGLAIADVVEDFTPGVDTLALQHIDARPGQPGDQEFRFIGSADFSGRGAEIRYDGGVVLGAIDRDAEADFRIRLAGAPELTGDDLLL